MPEDALFDMTPTPVPVPARVSPDRRRTERQAATIRSGGHPLHLAVPPVARHPETRDRPYSAQDPKGQPFTCGTCVLRVLEQHNSRTYPKCHADDGRRVTGGPGSDVRAWWPACTQYQPRDPAPAARR